MIIKWTEDLSVGVDEIDNQHKELIEKINNLAESIKENKGKEEVVKTLKYLEDYVAGHFSMEESYMEELGYEDYSSHKKEHASFIMDFLNLKLELSGNLPNITLVVHVYKRIWEWFKEHICKVDKSLGDFLKIKLQETAKR